MVNYRIHIGNCIAFIVPVLIFMSSCGMNSKRPSHIKFNPESIRRIGFRGDNWSLTWASDSSQITSMDNGKWPIQNQSVKDRSWPANDKPHYHNCLYRIKGDPDNFTREDIPGYPQFIREDQRWFGYGVYSVQGQIYALLSRTPSPEYDGPFTGIKMLKSSDNGKNWYRVNRDGRERLLEPDDEAKEKLNQEETFFYKEYGLTKHGKTAYPFSFCSFVQNGQDNQAAKDEYVYIYSPEGAEANRLCLARVNAGEIEHRKKWEYFSRWKKNTPVWTKNITERGAVHVFPDRNEKGEYFGWYSWLPSIVWNPGLNLYIMVNGGTYAGKGLTNSEEDYYDRWMHTKTGSLGFWYSENPYGPWEQFFYTDYWTADAKDNLTYQPKLSPKWISEDGRQMILIWSDAMKNENGESHTTNYLWNQMEIEIIVK